MTLTVAAAPTFNPAINTVTFAGYECRIKLQWYASRHLCLQLVDAEDQSPVTTATKSVDLKPEPGIVFVKDYSENHGILAVLIAAGVVEDTGETVAQGHAVLHICKLLIPEPPLA